jgi:hypothetical protein
MSGKFGPIARRSEPKGLAKLTSKLPSMGGGKRGSSSAARKSGMLGAGAALLTAAAGVAIKNREKLAGAANRRKDDDRSVPVSETSAGVPVSAPTTGTSGIADPALNGPAAETNIDPNIDPDTPGLGGRTSPA